MRTNKRNSRSRWRKNSLEVGRENKELPHHESLRGEKVDGSLRTREVKKTGVEAYSMYLRSSLTCQSSFRMLG